MTPFELFDVIKQIESVYAAERFVLGGVNHWMIVRLLLLGHLAGKASRRTNEIASVPAHSRMIDNPLTGVMSAEMLPTSYRCQSLENSALLFEPPNARLAGADMIFFELPVDYTQVINGKAVNRIADGFVEAFGSRIRKVCRFTPELVKLARRVDPSFVFLAPPALDIHVGERARFVTAVRDLCAMIYRLSPDFALTPGPIVNSIELVLSQAAGHAAWLREVAPRLVGFQSFISMEKMAVLVACKRLGIRTIEVQHGYCDDNSIFNEMPPGDAAGFTIFPDIFWCWGPRSLRALSKDSGFLANNVELVLGGDVWGTLAEQQASTELDSFLARVKADNYSRRILFAYQIEALAQSDDHEVLIPQFVLDAMSRMPARWLWMIRVHPRSSHLINPIQNLLAASGIGNCEVEVTSLAPIEVTLKAADVYLTGFSVSALEANAVKKPVILLDQVGKRLFSDLVDQGAFGYADNAVDLCAQLESPPSPTIDAGYYTRDLKRSQKAFNQLFEPSVPAARASGLAGRLVSLSARRAARK